MQVVVRPQKVMADDIQSGYPYSLKSRGAMQMYYRRVDYTAEKSNAITFWGRIRINNFNRPSKVINVLY